MRVNQYVARATGMSRRAADEAINRGLVKINGAVASLGQVVNDRDSVMLDSKPLELQSEYTIILNKPVGYVTSRRQQGSDPTIYSLLPEELHGLKPVGRLDKDSSGLLILTNNGHLAQELQHPSSGKWKVYEVGLNKELTDDDLKHLQAGVELEDGVSHMDVSGAGRNCMVKLQEGRNRQIRRTFDALGYRVQTLHRTNFGEFDLTGVDPGKWRNIEAR